MKKGFTLMELLFVIVIVAVVSISSVIVFGNIDDETSEKDRANVYMEIQRGAILYVDLNDTWLEQFKEHGNIKVELSELMNSNYVDINIEDPVTNKQIPMNHMVQIFTNKDAYGKEYIDTCIVSKAALLKVYCNENRVCDGNELKCPDKDNCNCYNATICNAESCVANSKGETKNCCVGFVEE